MFHTVQWYAKANNKYMKDYDPNKESSYLIYRNVNNLYGWVISQKLHVDDFEQTRDLFRSNEEFTQDCDEDSGKGYILDEDIKYHKVLHQLRSDLPFSPKRKKIDKCEKFVCKLYDEKYHTHRALKQGHPRS